MSMFDRCWKKSEYHDDDVREIINSIAYVTIVTVVK